MKPTLTPADLERFWSKVEKTPTCWLWRDAPNWDGYGQFFATIDGTRVVYRAHRVSFQAANGPLAERLVVDHICRVRHCVNPEHLRAVTNRENVLAGIGISAINARKTHCKRGHEFTPENTYRGSTGQRECLECKQMLRSVATARRAQRQATCETCGLVVTASNISRHRKKQHGERALR